MKKEHHHTQHVHNLQSLNRSFLIAIIVNIVFVVAESVAGWISGSMGLLSDAGHNLGDVASLILAFIAVKLSGIQSNGKYTYGYKKSTILVSLLNAVILLVAVVLIIMESVDKFLHPQPVNGVVIIGMAALGILINGGTAWLFVREGEHDLNVRGAYLHMAMDALVSAGVVVSGILIQITGWYRTDAIVGLAVAVVIVISTWKLLKSSIRLALDGVPESIDAGQLKNALLRCKGVVDVHHLHIWALSTTETALTTHLVVEDITQSERIKAEIKEMLSQYKIGHVTLELEPDGCTCTDAYHINSK